MGFLLCIYPDALVGWHDFSVSLGYGNRPLGFLVGFRPILYLVETDSLPRYWRSQQI